MTNLTSKIPHVTLKQETLNKNNIIIENGVSNILIDSDFYYCFELNRMKKFKNGFILISSNLGFMLSEKINVFCKNNNNTAITLHSKF